MSVFGIQGSFTRAAVAAGVFAAVGLGPGARPAVAGIITDHTATGFDARYDRFASGFPNAPVPNTSPTFVGSGTDFSGVGWFFADGNTFSIAMVSERHFIGAAHVNPGPGGFVFLYDPVSNVVRNYQVRSGQVPVTQFVNSQGQAQTLPSDVFLGTLMAPIPASHNIGFFPVAGGPESDFIGRSTLHYGQNQAYGVGNQLHIGRNNVQAIDTFFNRATSPTAAFRGFAYDWTPANSGEIYLIGGDSGGPSFINLGGRLTLLGAHYGVTPGTPPPQPGDISVDTFFPYYLSQLNAFMAQDTDPTHPNGYSLTIVPIPEPGALALTAVVAAIAAGRAYRRRGCETGPG
jgi:hypothetical protein